MNNHKFILSLLLSIFLLTGCSLIKDKIEELITDEGDDNSDLAVEKKSIEDYPENDLEFFSKYIETVNNLSSQVDAVQSAYLESVPEPSAIKNTSMIFVISPEVSLTFLERNVKELKRSFYDNGELAKLKAGNKRMKASFEKNFDELLREAENYTSKAAEVINFYKGRKYVNNIPEAVMLDKGLNQSYELYSEKMESLKEVIDQFRPVSLLKNPDNYSGNERSFIILENAYIEVMNDAEILYDKTYNLNFRERDNTYQGSLNDLETTLKNNQKLIDGLTFPETSKYLKYNFEDYFSKTAFSLVDAAEKFSDVMNKRNPDKREFNREQDAVLRHYNYLVRAYNTSLNLIAQYRKLNL